jgi:hypothetical protein
MSVDYIPAACLFVVQVYLLPVLMLALVKITYGSGTT